MRSVVMGLIMLAGAAVREQGKGVDDFGWRGGEQSGARVEVNSGSAVTVIAGRRLGRCR